ncbi:MAG: hypothetical protein ACJATV_000250 [Granulosicoccus sp.]|jgi:hypothetical protein
MSAPLLFSHTLGLIFSALLFFSFNAFAVTSGYCPAREGASIVGVATQIDSGDFLYCEYHYLQDQQSTVMDSVQSMGDAVMATVEYRDKSEELLATKKADFSIDRLAPNIEQTDNRHGEKILIQRKNNKDETGVIAISYQAPKVETVNTVEFDASNNLVADAGFDNAVRTYWGDIVAKQKVIIEFAAPVQQTTVNLSIKSRDMKRCNSLNDRGSDKDSGGVADSISYNDSAHLCVTAQAANVFLNWFVKPIVLVYERQSQRLLAFSGSVNLSDNNGDAQSATILYRYQ